MLDVVPYEEWADVDDRDVKYLPGRQLQGASTEFGSQPGPFLARAEGA